MKALFKELDDEFNLKSMFDEEEGIQKIIEFKCDREQMVQWIQDSL